MKRRKKIEEKRKEEERKEEKTRKDLWTTHDRRKKAKNCRYIIRFISFLNHDFAVTKSCMQKSDFAANLRRVYELYVK
jgi:hypothetical protein